MLCILHSLRYRYFCFHCLHPSIIVGNLEEEREQVWDLLADLVAPVVLLGRQVGGLGREDRLVSVFRVNLACTFSVAAVCSENVVVLCLVALQALHPFKVAMC
ncbi:hypothetical protein DsansV1_C07g0070341 [Dioscorea sansibarensis]